MCETGSQREYWAEVYARRDPTDVSWFEAHAEDSLAALQSVGATPEQGMVDVGSGASRLLDALIARGFHDLTAVDVSEQALAHSRERLGEGAKTVCWVTTNVLEWRPERRYDLWHDRALFHFLTAAEDRDRYRSVLSRALAPGGRAVIATFAEDGPTQCSGLPTARYSAQELATEMSDLTVVTSSRVLHRTPAGAEQPFTWLCLQSPAT